MRKMAFRRILVIMFAILLAQPTSQIHLTRLSLLRVARSMDGVLQSRVKRQAITDPQPFPVMNAVLSIPIPTNIGHFPGAASPPVDKCDRDEILMEDGTCQNLLTGGNCGPNEEILLDPDTNVGFCAPRLCPPDRVFVHATQLCHDPQEMGICPPGRELYYSAYGTSVCSCPDGTIEGDDDLDDDVCELILGESLQCLPGQVFWFKDFNSPPECLPDPCKGTNLNNKPNDLPFVPSKATGECFQLGASEGVCPTGLFYTLAIDDLKGECESLEDAGYNIFSPDELEALKKIYGPTISANAGPPISTNTNTSIEPNRSSTLASAGVPISTASSVQSNNRLNFDPISGTNTGDIQLGQNALGNVISQTGISAAASAVSAVNIDKTRLETSPEQNPGVITNQNTAQNDLQQSVLSPIQGTVASEVHSPSGQTNTFSNNTSSSIILSSNKHVESDQSITKSQSVQKQISPGSNVDGNPISSSNVNMSFDGSSVAPQTAQNSQLLDTSSHSIQHIKPGQVSLDNNLSAIQTSQQNINSLSNKPILQTQLNNNMHQQNGNSISLHKDSLIESNKKPISNSENIEQTRPLQTNIISEFTSGTSNSQPPIVDTQLTKEQQITGVSETNENVVNANQQNVGATSQQFVGGHQPLVSVHNNQAIRPSQVGNNLTPSISNIHGPVGNHGQANNNQHQNSLEMNLNGGQSSIGNLDQSNNQQSQELIGEQGIASIQGSLGNIGQSNNQQQNSQESLGGIGQQNSPELFGQNPSRNLQQSYEIFGNGGLPNFGFRFRRQILNDPVWSTANEISIFNANDNSLTILSRRKRALYSYATPSNVFESRLLGCKAGAARDINAKCRKKILPAKVPKHRNTRAAPPVPPTPSCPSGQAFNLRRRCVPTSTAQQSLMAKNLG